MVIAVDNAVLNAGKLSIGADVSVCSKTGAAIRAGAINSGAEAIVNISVKNAEDVVSIL